MAKFRKKPIEIEAFTVSDLLGRVRCQWSSLPAWVKAAYDRGELIFLDKSISVKTLEGVMRGEWEDWLIQGVKGEIYPCKPDVMEASYDAS